MSTEININNLLYIIQIYKIYYKNIHNILPVSFQRFLHNYINGSAHNHNLRLPMTRKEYYVQAQAINSLS